MFGASESREHDLGKLHGDLAVINDYHPVKELEWVTPQLESIDGLPSEEVAMNFICEMTEFTARVREFLSFFTRENIEVVHAFGTHRLNQLYFTATFDLIQKRPSVRIKHHSKITKLDVGPGFGALEYTWPRR